MITWKEERTYKGQESNTAFSANIATFSLFLTCNHIYNPGNWVMHLMPGKLADTMTIGLDKSADIEEAKERALRMAYDLLYKQKQLTEDALYQIEKDALYKIQTAVAADK